MPDLRIAGRLVLCLAVAVCGCVQETAPPDEGARILAIGDSILAWNRTSERSIADEVERLTGREVIDRSVIGARLLPAVSIVGLLKGPIAEQYVPGDWDWAIVSAGGNDLWWGCGCTRCDEHLDDLISEDGRTGAAPDLARRLRATGARVIWLGYPDAQGRASPVSQCRDIGARYEARLARMAASDGGIHLVSNRAPGTAGELGHLSSIDRIHPSPSGSAAIAARIAATIRASMH